MKQEKKNKDRLVAFRVSKTEYEKLVKFQKATTCHKLSEYIRNVVLRDPVYVKTRNLSLDAFVLEIVALRNQFKAVGFNFNQIVHKLHTLQNLSEFSVWLLVNEKHKAQLFAKIKELQDGFRQIHYCYTRYPIPFEGYIRRIWDTDTRLSRFAKDSQCH